MGSGWQVDLCLGSREVLVGDARGLGTCYAGFMVRLPMVIVALAWLPACSSSDSAPAGQPTPPQDAGQQDTMPSDGGPEATANPEASSDAGVAGDQDVPEADAGQQGEDAGAEAGAPRPAGQCKTDGECDQGFSCNVGAPGGICGCGTEDDCADSLKFTCVMGACVRYCDTDVDCPQGFECAGSGRCMLLSCKSSDCPAPYVCVGASFCGNPPCSDAAAPCPDGFTCSQGSCIQ